MVVTQQQEICPYAKELPDHERVRGCTVSAQRMIARNSLTTYLFACPPVCYMGDYENCPRYKPPEASS